MGLDLGLERTGQFEVVACVEVERAFCETIRVNQAKGRLSPKLIVLERDIASLSVEEFLKETKLRPGDIDLLVGGPPCQSFSTAGKRRSIQDHRGTLLWHFLRFIDGLRPKFFLMENVRGLLSAALSHRPIAQRPEKGGPALRPDETSGSVVRAFADDLQKIAGSPYHMDCFEVNAVNYGAPQLRERALFIGNRFNIEVDFPAPTHGPVRDAVETPPDLFQAGTQAGTPQTPWRTLRDAIGGLNDPGLEIMDFSPRKKGFLALVPQGSNWRSLPVELQKESMGSAWHAKGGRSGWWRRLSFDLPCPTLVTMPNHASTALCHPTELRALTVKEYMRIQEFPDDWDLCGRTTEKYAQVGNAVPVRLGEVAGRALAGAMDALASKAWAVSSDRGVRPYRLVYVQSHVRTRQWFKGGETFIWADGDEAVRPTYGAAVTKRKERKISDMALDSSRKRRPNGNELFDLLKAPQHTFLEKELKEQFLKIKRARVEALAADLRGYIEANLPDAIDKRQHIADYRSNPYVLMTAASVMKLDTPQAFGSFLFNSKLYMALETSFGKSVEKLLVRPYPIARRQRWDDPPEKLNEQEALHGLSRQDKARARTTAVWREIDRACVIKDRRFLVSIKSGPNTINDTQVQGMVDAIKNNYQEWWQKTKVTYPTVKNLDIVIGLTYGTERTTNNKENQIIAKMLDYGFVEEDKEGKPGVLVDTATRSIRIYRRVGRSFWAWIADPFEEKEVSYAFLEILLALAIALSDGLKRDDLEGRINNRLDALSNAIKGLRFPQNSLPDWIGTNLGEKELTWFATALTAFYDDGI